MATGPTASSSNRIADRLAAARRERFVGRAAEIGLLRTALVAPEPEVAVLHFHGPGGVGKTTLLREYARIATELGRRATYIDGRNLEPSPTGFLAALAGALSLPPGQLASVAQHWPADGVLLVDTYEVLTPIDGWLRDTFLPQLPAGSLIVIAGRNEPAPAWRTDADWSNLARIVALENLGAEESRTYLAVRGVPEEYHPETLAFTRGHPLALSLVADVLTRGAPIGPFHPEQEPDVIRVLLEKFARDVPSTDHRLALQVCATAWATTEALLAHALQRPDVHDIFEWLSRLSFIQHGPYGLFPHDLARDVLYADFRWRNPDQCRRLIERILAYFYGKLHQAAGVEQQRIWFNLLYVQRYNPIIGPFMQWNMWGTVYAEPASASDHADILAMVERHEGKESAAIARYWLGRQPSAFYSFRKVTGELFGFMGHLRIEDATERDRAVDPAIRAASEFARRHGPVRPGEEVAHLRWWMGAETYQGISQASNLAVIVASLYWTSHPKMAWSFVSFANGDFFEAVMTDVHFWRSQEAGFEVGGRRYATFTHDWRVETAAEWVSTKADRAMRTGPEIAPRANVATRLVLTREEFAEAVRNALREYMRPDKLAANPLRRTQLVGPAETESGAAEALRRLLREAAESLSHTPKDKKLYLALWHTYLQPAPTQEQAAELLDLPFNTYRYQLAKGTERVTEWLWQREVAGPAGSP